MRIMIAGGGTGGHVYPGVAVAEELRRANPDVELLFVGTKRGVEKKIIPELGYELKIVHARGFPRKVTPVLLLAFIDFFLGLLQAAKMIISWKPDCVVGTGGYVSCPTLMVAKLLRKSTLIQEQNTVPGLSNRLLSLFADEIHISFAESRKFFRRKTRLRLSGNPVRRSVVEGESGQGLEEFGFSKGKKTVFVFGGSRGAKRINEAIVRTVTVLKNREDIQYIIQTGERDFSLVSESLKEFKDRVWIRAYLDRIEAAYKVADIVVARAGATALAEIAASGLPSILIPYPYATHGHQEVNAAAFKEAGAARVIRESELTGERLAGVIVSILDDSVTLRKMSKCARGMARYDAAEKIARCIERLAGGHHPPDAGN
ncbi:MAG: undecaprenyldiphospho-muramoylpentapeptide beta-N-acetylglucosaminyltransferase [Candidatus Eisenbacteria bacterium]|nr:undecaprenyldiphospho-muramoylpentapeptide beta-N-acetylglucosaminyltransferase [Candidatus Eisenbacteria bacterium]